jgi:hypothetical protein
MAREDEGEGVRIQVSGLGCNARCRRGTGISISGKVSLGILVNKMQTSLHTESVRVRG